MPDSIDHRSGQGSPCRTAVWPVRTTTRGSGSTTPTGRTTIGTTREHP